MLLLAQSQCAPDFIFARSIIEYRFLYRTLDAIQRFLQHILAPPESLLRRNIVLRHTRSDAAASYDITAERSMRSNARCIRFLMMALTARLRAGLLLPAAHDIPINHSI